VSLKSVNPENPYNEGVSYGSRDFNDRFLVLQMLVMVLYLEDAVNCSYNYWM